MTLAVDSWSNINNSPVISGSITKYDGKMILAKTVDAAGEKHDAFYLKRITYEMTCGVQTNFECKVGAIVTDSARAMANESGISE